jgi:hypothetical protein
MDLLGYEGKEGPEGSLLGCAVLNPSHVCLHGYRNGVLVGGKI